MASTNNVSGRLRSIRDDAFSRLGSHAPAFTVTDVDPNPDPGIARRVEGTFCVPLYLTGDGSSGNRFDNGADGLPHVNGTYNAHFTCIVPAVALSRPCASRSSTATGLFGGRDEVNAGNVRAMAIEHDMVECATDWIGMAEDDIGNAAIDPGRPVPVPDACRPVTARHPEHAVPRPVAASSATGSRRRRRSAIPRAHR